MKNGKTITSLKELEEYAAMNDGECAVGKDSRNNIRVFDTGEEARNDDRIIKWDYYFSDEAELFDVDNFF